MGIKTLIEYCDSTANPIWGCGGCELWNPKCRTCYAGRFIRRMGGEFDKPVMKPGAIEKTLKWADLAGKARETKPWLNTYPRIIFLNDMSDSWTEKIWTDRGAKRLAYDWLDEYMDRMAESPHIYLLLTKRPRRAVEYFSRTFVPRNIWLGTSITSSCTLQRAKELAKLRDICEGKLWLSIEPLRGKLTFDSGILRLYDWAALGGESGNRLYPTLMEEFAHVINQCCMAGPRVFVKQLGSAYAGYGTKGQEFDRWPEDMKVRQMPGV